MKTNNPERRIVMPVLTNFLSAINLDEQEVAKRDNYIEQITVFNNAIDTMHQAFNIKISKNSEIGKTILKKEAAVYREFWRTVGYIPTGFEKSCLNIKMPYNYLCDLSKYPVTKISNLKQIADSLGFVIIPLDYVDIHKIIQMYDKQDRHYAKLIHLAYNEFIKLLSICQDYTGKQQLYMLAPVSFYNPWKEVSCERPVPKYFSVKLKDLSTTLGMIIPTQRNLYKMITTTEINVSNLNETMHENFKSVEKSINECHYRLDWVENLTKNLVVRVNSLESRTESLSSQLNNMRMELKSLQLQVTQLEHILLCLLDPIIFSVKAGVNISNPTSDNENARVGLCFGMDMPIDFFVQNGMTIINDKRFEKVTYELKI